MAAITYETLSDVPDDLRDHAKEKDGKYVVSVAAQATIKEFRDNNISLVKERDDLTSKLTQYEQATGVLVPDLEEGKLSDFAKTLESLRETKKKVEDGKLVEETSLEEATAARVSEIHAGYKGQLESAAKEKEAHKQKADSAEKRANAMQVENAIRLAASHSDVAMIDKAVSLVLPKALNTFKVSDDGKITPRLADGTVIYSNTDGVSPMSIREWLLKEREENDFLFQGSKGGGASGNGDTAPGRITQAELDKMSPQAKMQYARKHNL